MSYLCYLFCLLLTSMPEGGLSCNPTPPPTPAPAFPTPPPYKYVPPPEWQDKPAINVSDTKDIIITKYANVLGQCTAEAKAGEMEKKFGIGLANLLTSLIPVVGGVTSIATSTAMDMFIGTGNCYMDKFKEYMQEFALGAVSESYIGTLQNHLEGYQLRLKNMVPSHAKVALEDLRREMIGDEPHFMDDGDQKPYAVIPTRDFINMRLALYEDLIPLVETEDIKQHYLREMVQLMIKGVGYIWVAAELFAKKREARVEPCKLTNAQADVGIKPGCYLRYQADGPGFGYDACVCDPPETNLFACKSYYVYFVPGLLGAEKSCGHDSPYKFLDKAGAEWRTFKEAMDEISSTLPWKDWRIIRDEACKKLTTRITECDFQF